MKPGTQAASDGAIISDAFLSFQTRPKFWPRRLAAFQSRFLHRPPTGRNSTNAHMDCNHFAQQPDCRDIGERSRDVARHHPLVLWRLQGAESELRCVAIITSFGYGLALELAGEVILLELQRTIEHLTAKSARRAGMPRIGSTLRIMLPVEREVPQASRPGSCVWRFPRPSCYK